MNLLISVEARNAMLKYLDDLTYGGRVFAQDIAPVRKFLMELPAEPSKEDEAPDQKASG
jgi:hypothetical protein